MFEEFLSIDKKIKSSKIDSINIITSLLIFVIGLAIFQDYLFSKLQNTGFYLSESLLYNFYWLFFLPFFLLTYHLSKTFSKNNNFLTTILTLGISIVCSFLHIVSFTFLFVLISNILFNPPHRFSSIFNAVLSNQYCITFLFYTIAPSIYRSFLQANQKNREPILQCPVTISFRIGATIQTITVDSIQAIATEKPYTVVHTNGRKFLSGKRLKDFENELDPTVFFRVHRSAIINKKFIKVLKSRKNGDYDVLLENGLWIRFSRHYRKNWLALLQ